MATQRPTRPRRPQRAGRVKSGTATAIDRNRARLAALRRQPPIRLARPRWPTAIADRYAARLRAIAEGAWAIVARTVLPVLRELAAEHRDAEEPEAEPFVLTPGPGRKRVWTPEEIAAFKAKAIAERQARGLPTPAVPRQLSFAVAVADRELHLFARGVPPTVHAEVAQEIERAAVKANVRVLGSLGLEPIAPGSALDEARAKWLKINAELITSIPRELADQVRGYVETMVPAGARWETIAGKLMTEHEISLRRATLIARDQVGKYHAELDRVQMQAAGITHYMWMGAMDNRERPVHVALEGSIWSWQSPPPIGNPGEPIQCRCQAMPVTSEQEIALQAAWTKEQLADRTAALGRMQKEPETITQSEIAERAAAQVAGEIRLAARRSEVARRQ